MGKRILMWLPAIMIMILIFIASAMHGDEIPRFGAIDLIVKKGGHMIGYALLSIACFLAAYGNTKKLPRSVIISLCIAIIYALADEYHQSFTPGRYPSVKDVGIDTAGAVIGIGIAVFIAKIRSGRASVK